MKVELLDKMGNDLAIVNAARVSFAKEATWEYECVDEEHKVYKPTLSKADQSLIRFLAHGCTLQEWLDLVETIVPELGAGQAEDLLYEIRNTPIHWTPFAQTAIKFHFKVPIFVARQMNKHQVGFVTNEVSRRYVDSMPDIYIPEFRERSPDKKQGSQEKIVDNDKECMALYSSAIEKAYNTYLELLKQNVAPEVARVVLPQSMYTEFITTGNLYNWSNFVKTRRRDDAQKEIRWVAQQVEKHLRDLFPISAKELLW